MLNMRQNIEYDDAAGIAHFNDYQIILSRKKVIPFTIDTFTDFEFDSLVVSLISLVMQYQATPYYEESPLYRLYLCYVEIREERLCKTNRPLTFGQFLRCIMDDNSGFQFSLVGENTIADLRRDKINRRVIKQLMTTPMMHYDHGYIHGLNFKSRGPQFRECIEPNPIARRYGQQQMDYEPSNPINNIENCWNDKIHFSSWCCYFDNHKKMKYALINFFFRLNVSADPVLHNVPIASVCTYNHDMVRQLSIISIRDGKRSNKSTTNNLNYPFDHKADLFIPATSICSTNLLSLGIDHRKFPIAVKSKYDSCIVDARKHYSIVKPNEVYALILLKLQPERLKITFDRDAYKAKLYTDDSKDYVR